MSPRQTRDSVHGVRLPTHADYRELTPREQVHAELQECLDRQARMIMLVMGMTVLTLIICALVTPSTTLTILTVGAAIVVAIITFAIQRELST